MKNKKVVDSDDEIRVFKKYKNMDPINKVLMCLYILIFLTILNMVLPFIVSYFQSKSLNSGNSYDTSDFKVITGNALKNIGDKSNKDILFICNENFMECHDFLDVVHKAQKEYNLDVYYLNAEELNNEEYRNILLKYDNENGFIDSSLGQVPLVFVLSNNKLVEGWVGVSNYENYLDFLKKSNVIN